MGTVCCAEPKEEQTTLNCDANKYYRSQQKHPQRTLSIVNEASQNLEYSKPQSLYMHGDLGVSRNTHLLPNIIEDDKSEISKRSFSSNANYNRKMMTDDNKISIIGSNTSVVDSEYDISGPSIGHSKSALGQQPQAHFQTDNKHKKGVTFTSVPDKQKVELEDELSSDMFLEKFDRIKNVLRIPAPYIENTRFEQCLYGLSSHVNKIERIRIDFSEINTKTTGRRALQKMSKNLSVLINRKYKYDLAKISKVASIVKALSRKENFSGEIGCDKQRDELVIGIGSEKELEQINSIYSVLLCQQMWLGMSDKKASDLDYSRLFEKQLYFLKTFKFIRHFRQIVIQSLILIKGQDDDVFNFESYLINMKQLEFIVVRVKGNKEHIEHPKVKKIQIICLNLDIGFEIRD